MQSIIEELYDEMLKEENKGKTPEQILEAYKQKQLRMAGELFADAAVPTAED